MNTKLCVIFIIKSKHKLDSVERNINLIDTK